MNTGYRKSTKEDGLLFIPSAPFLGVVICVTRRSGQTNPGLPGFVLNHEKPEAL